MNRRIASLTILAAAACAAAPVAAQDRDGGDRWRVGVGPQLTPSYPGADTLSLGPFFVVDRSDDGGPLEFEAPDESTGFAVLETGGFAFGPSIGFEGSRKPEDVGAAVDEVGFTFELGGFVEYRFDAPVRLRLEARRGLGGHKGWVGVASADYILREGDKWLFSAGPRVTLADESYHEAYFGVSPAAAARTGLPEYGSDGGVHAVGAAAGYLTQLSPRWGIYGYVRYDRLVGAAADSPLVRSYGSRDQFFGGATLTYSFGRGID
ncbi:MipA/OmpV family protein [Sphingosinithalassobacter sp. LHW66-3]|uniref:MipA/OmpV family protein n=1 Tax=Sphingosinithalassobacter sp. LHW66-3 TaxID=3424718 RepID=UPI003D6B4FCE